VLDISQKKMYINMKFQTEEEARRSDQHSHRRIDDDISPTAAVRRAPPKQKQATAR
jgi:hypothetical protein